MFAEGSVTDAVRGVKEYEWFASEMGTHTSHGLIRALLPEKPHVPIS